MPLCVWLRACVPLGRRGGSGRRPWRRGPVKASRDVSPLNRLVHGRTRDRVKRQSIDTNTDRPTDPVTAGVYIRIQMCLAMPHLGVPQEREHELVRVEDAGGRGEERLCVHCMMHFIVKHVICDITSSSTNKLFNAHKRASTKHQITHQPTHEPCCIGRWAPGPAPPPGLGTEGPPPRSPRRGGGWPGGMYVCCVALTGAYGLLLDPVVFFFACDKARARVSH